MAEIIYQSSNELTQGPVWLIQRQPEGVTNPLVVRFLKRGKHRNIVDNMAEWCPRNGDVLRGGVWNYRRWVPKSPTVPQWLLKHVEDHMRFVAAQHGAASSLDNESF